MIQSALRADDAAFRDAAAPIAAKPTAQRSRLRGCAVSLRQRRASSPRPRRRGHRSGLRSAAVRRDGRERIAEEGQHDGNRRHGARSSELGRRARGRIRATPHRRLGAGDLGVGDIARGDGRARR
ncbi:hypothetical protein [Lysobacter enzymogenes]|uniref:hypothetical protein n=1 Tax=Lysobacter enzymogenes TaxID=69 RepID=UPI001AF2C755|nr:hypothetical protein [Lysobacter enzymogenes]QQQ01314.1 hypothetical protein JHW41_25310 [Lysobacter enzymogenes]